MHGANQGSSSTSGQSHTGNAVRGRVACVPCRLRKTRCPGPTDDGHDETCGRCSRLSLRCYWQDRKPAKEGKKHQGSSPPSNAEHSPQRARKSSLDAAIASVRRGDPKLSPSVTPEEVQTLVDLYFRSVHFFGCMNFIHQPSFMRLLEMKKAPKDLTSAMVACTLRFARDPSPAALERADAIEDQVINSIRGSIYDSFGAIDLMTVVLLRVYEYARGRTTSHWLLWGHAVRMMQYLSLQTLDQTYASAKLPANPLLRAEALRRLAWYILFHDTMVDAGIHGDHLITENSYSIQLPCDDVSFEAGIDVETGPLGLGTSIVFAPPVHSTGSALSPPVITRNRTSLLGHLIRIGLCRRRILHFNSSIEASTDTVEVLLERLKVIQDAVTHVIVDLPPEFTYTKYNMIRHDPARAQFVLLHLLRHNCFLMLSLARLNIAKKHHQPESMGVSSRQERIKHALAVSRIIGDVNGQNVLSEQIVHAQVYSCVEILLFDPRKLARAGLPVNPLDRTYVEGLKILMDSIRKESPKYQFTDFLRAEACHRLIRCGFEHLVHECDHEALRNLEYTSSRFSVAHSDRLQVNDVDDEFNFRNTKFHLPENRETSGTASSRAWLLGKNDPLSGDQGRPPAVDPDDEDGASTPMGVDAGDTMFENDAATVARQGVDGGVGDDNGDIDPKFLFGNLEAMPALPNFGAGAVDMATRTVPTLTSPWGQHLEGPTIGPGAPSLDGDDDWATLFGHHPAESEPSDPLTDINWMMNM